MDGWMFWVNLLLQAYMTKGLRIKGSEMFQQFTPSDLLLPAFFLCVRRAAVALRWGVGSMWRSLSACPASLQCDAQTELTANRQSLP